MYNYSIHPGQEIITTVTTRKIEEERGEPLNLGMQQNTTDPSYNKQGKVKVQLKRKKYQKSETEPRVPPNHPQASGTKEEVKIKRC